MASSTRAILFDFGGTLDHPHHWLDRFVRHYHAAGMRLGRAELDVAYSHATRIAYQAGEEIHRLSLHELVRFLVAHQFDHLHGHGSDSVREHLSALGEDRHRLADRIASGFAEESAEGLARSRGLLKELSHDFKLGVVSNFYGNLQVVLFEAGIRELIQVAIDSKHMRVFKPDERIFVAALKVLDLPHNQVAMVGDSLHKDCAPARKLGMRSIWLRGHHAASGEHPPASETAVLADHTVADHTIDALDELKRLKW
ncbi:MAG: HAD family hydrolase [Candidatus Binataceae bacterium]